MIRHGLGPRLPGVAEALARSLLPVDAPEVVRFVSGVGWRVQAALCGTRGRLVQEEALATFGVDGATLGAVTREAHDLALQTLLEGVLVPRLEDVRLDDVLRVRGLARDGAVVTWATTGPRALLARALARQAQSLGREVVLFRGPLEHGALPGVPARVAKARRADEDRLPVRWVEDPDALLAARATGAIVGGAWDDRAWGTFSPRSLLGRTVLFPNTLVRLAEAGGGSLVHATLVRERDKRWVLTFRLPVAEARFLDDEATPFLRAYPGHWASWLGTCAAAAERGRDPLFLPMQRVDASPLPG